MTTDYNRLKGHIFVSFDNPASRDFPAIPSLWVDIIRYFWAEKIEIHERKMQQKSGQFSLPADLGSLTVTISAQWLPPSKLP